MGNIISLQQCGNHFNVTREYVRQVLVEYKIVTRHNPVKPAAPKPPKLTPETRLQKRKAQFWSQINITPNIDECWEWLNGCGEGGYGNFSIGELGIHAAHVAAFMFTHDTKPQHWVLHRCNNPRCCNPNHLYDGTPSDNALDRERARKASGKPLRRKPKPPPSNWSEIRKRYQNGESSTQLAQLYNVHQTTISRWLVKYAD